MTNQELNKRFAELAGIKWHEELDKDGYCTCGHYHVQQASDYNPDFVADPRLVLREMMKRKDWGDFCSTIGYRITNGGFFDGEKYNPRWYELVEINYIIDNTTGLLVRAAIDFMEASK